MLAHTRRSLHVAWRLACFDAAALALFDLSAAGFWRSFGAAFVALPLFALALVPSYDRAAEPEWFIAVEAAHYLAAWIAFPLVMVPVARLLRLQEHYRPFIIAVNWTSVLQLALFLPVNLLALFGSLEGDGGAFLFAFALSLTCIYRFFVARVALQASRGSAVALVALDVVLGLLISGLFDQLYAVISSSAPMS